MNKSPYFKLIVCLILGFCIGYLIPSINLPFIKKNNNNILLKENIKLNKQIEERNNKILKNDSLFNKLKEENVLLENRIYVMDNFIYKIQHKIDSVNSLIYISDDNITKIKKQGYEEINSVNNWNTNQRVKFFEGYFETNRP